MLLHLLLMDLLLGLDPQPPMVMNQPRLLAL
uniref:Uncharacterized protein n=2 Tax=Picea TaxID=3328 RepID=A0A101LWD6_PICGL|nr:hypothetical protein ABT39_MTgene1477 [Picea glauca]QHR92675.1 hypothetical protein Q903MT_gene6723 [Picea sitchensis]